MDRLTAVCLCCLGLASGVAAAERAVIPGGLASALADASPGDTLRLLTGVHRGTFRVTKALHLEGEPGAILEGEGTGTTLTLAADGIALSHLTVRGSGADLSADDAVILVAEAKGVTIERCEVGARAFGIYLQAGSGHRIVGNRVTGDSSLPIARRGNGIHLWHTQGNEILDNELIEVRDGVYLSFAHDNLIEGNHGVGLRYGIHYMYSERNTLTGNRFSDCSGGIALMYSMRNRIEANAAVGNRQFGILCQQLENSVLVANRAAGNGRGFYIENSVGNRFESNRIEGNGVGTYFTAGSEGNIFSGNRFNGNLVHVFEHHSGGNLFSDEGRGNFWSDYAGFDWNGDGVGETPYRLLTTASALLARRPAARWFWMSPVLALLDWWDASLTPQPAGALDPFPLVDPPTETSP